jgi:phosphatidylglycerol lysyltransferase
MHSKVKPETVKTETQRWLLRWLLPGVGLVLLVIVAMVLHHLLRHYHLHEIKAAMRATNPVRLMLALGLTGVTYAVLTCYDLIAFQYIRNPLAYRRIALASFIGYAFSNNIGLANLAGGSVRYRFYSAWGLSALEIAKVIALCSLTFWLGFLLVGGTAFVVDPIAIPGQLQLHHIALRPLGAIMLGVVALYAGLGLTRRKALKLLDGELEWPSLQIMRRQLLIGALDWMLTAGILYLLLPPELQVSYPALLSLFVLAQLCGLITHVPGGVGVFETVMLFGLQGHGVAVPMLLGTLIVYRCCYYLVPLGLALLLLAGHEVRHRREQLTQLGQTIAGWGQWITPLVPFFMASITFIAGALLLFSGATPALNSRLHVLGKLVALPVLEVSHFLGSLIGAALLVLSRGLLRRIDAAYVMTCLLLLAGIVVSLLKGLEYEQAALLSFMLLALLPCRRHFYREGTLMGQVFSLHWVVAMVLVLGATILLGLFSFKHVEYSSQLWWRFSMHGGDAPRFLRALVGALGLLLMLGVIQLLRPSAPARTATTTDDRTRLRDVLARSPRTSAQLALLGDKRLLWSETGKSFIMYAVEGRSWVALGDPVGDAREFAELLWHFREMSDRHQGWTVFYQASAELLPEYLDLGLTALKLGEEARVPLGDFTLEGGDKKNMRQSFRKLAEKEGCRFEWVAREAVAGLLPEFQEISEEWLAHKNTREKSFSLGNFSAEYLQEFPAGIVRRGERIEAFANILLGGDGQEISIDLMRYRPNGVPGVMEFLLLSLMLAGQARGYAWFNLGMAPLSGMENRALAPLWTRLGGLLYRHAEHYYNFKGLRAYKEKYHPAWEPKYLIVPGGLQLPRILTNIATLIAGGIKGVVGK